MNYQEVEGDLIALAKEGEFDVIAHGCNCFCIMGAGLAPQMAAAFGANKFSLEHDMFAGDYNKLGQIEYEERIVSNGIAYSTRTPIPPKGKILTVVNCYSQYDMTGRRRGEIDLDYSALALCFKKMNHIFKGKHIGLPQIGCHLAGGDWNIVREMIKNSFPDCTVTVVNYKPNK